MNREIVGSSEQLLIQFGTTYVATNLWRVDPVGDPVGTVFCLHNFPGNGLDFTGLANFLARNGYRVICPDLLGRGRSEPFPNVERALPQLVKATGTVLGKYAGRNSALIGFGWGAAIGLAALGMSRERVERFIAVDVPIDFSADHDPVIQHELASAARTFDDEAAALAHVVGSPEFEGSPVTPEQLRHRVRADGAVFGMNYDPVVLKGLERLSAMTFDLGRGLAALNTQILLLHGTALAGRDQRRLREFSASHTGALMLEGTEPRILLRSPTEMLMVLGFLVAGSAGLPPAGIGSVDGR